MNQVTVAMLSPGPRESLLPVKKVRQNRQRRKQSLAPLPPTEETIARLNAIGKEYPFCVYYKEKDIDLL